MKKYSLNLIVATFGAFAVAVAHAELNPTSLPGDTRLVQFEYEPDNTFLVIARPNSLTHIEFSPDETIETVGAGDTANWELKPTSNRMHLFVKPKFDNITTSMTVITSKRTYQFMLRSTTPNSKWYQRVNWRYTSLVLQEFQKKEEAAAQSAAHIAAEAKMRSDQTIAAGVTPDALRFGFSITGDAPFRPETIFDDGKFTYIRLPQTATELPAVFGTTLTEPLSIVNYVVKEPYLLVQKVIESGVLKLGKQEVKFERVKPKPTMFQRMFGAENQ